MATIDTEEAGVGRSLEGVSSEQQRCQFGEALAEWRSSEQVENGIPSTSPPFWDSDGDDEGGSTCILYQLATFIFIALEDSDSTFHCLSHTLKILIYKRVFC